VWSSKALQHLDAEALPMVLAGVHRAMAVGAPLDITVFDHARPDGGTEPTTAVTDGTDDFPGRRFTFWHPDALAHLLTGAGFAVDEVAAGPGADFRNVTARARRARSLPDTVGPGMRLLVSGLNPSLYAADAGVGYARPGNRFWPAALAAGLASVDRDPDHALAHHGMGMTDVVKRATVAAAELTTAEYRSGMDRLRRLAGWLRPGAVCFVGLAGWRAAVDRKAVAGVQPEGLAGVPVYVMPSTSGLNAHSSLADLTAHLRSALALADG
jgi:TDG/mug DNA glycosylase family protein